MNPSWVAVHPVHGICNFIVRGRTASEFRQLADDMDRNAGQSLEKSKFTVRQDLVARLQINSTAIVCHYLFRSHL